MNIVYIFTRLFDPDDTRLSLVQDVLRAEGFTVSVLAERSRVRDLPNNVIDLRNRAVGILIFGSQLVIAGIILGYFARVLPAVMTVFFWSSVTVSVFIASRYGKGVRDKLVKIIGAYLVRLTLAQKKPCAVWVIAPWRNEVVEKAWRKKGIVFVADFQTGKNGDQQETDFRGSRIDAKQVSRNANIILGDPESVYGLAEREAATSAKYVVDVGSAAAKLSRLIEQLAR